MIPMYKKRSTRQLLAIFSIIIVVSIVILWQIFGVVTSGFRESMSNESSNHLIEISNLIKQSIESTLESNWQLTESLASVITDRNYQNEEELLGFLQKQCDICDISAIYVFNENGESINEKGNAIDNDVASDLILETRENGYSFSISESMVQYSIPLYTENMFNNSKIAAMSLCFELSDMIDNMKVSSFNNNAQIYLTRRNGVKISMLSAVNAKSVYNVLTLFDTDMQDKNREITLTEAIDKGINSVFYYGEGENENYLSLTSIKTVDDVWYLFYIVPTAVLNGSMNTFLGSLTTAIIVLVILISTVIVISIVLIYRSNLKQYDSEIELRERMFDLLVSETENVFALISMEQLEPLYVTSNIEYMMGEGSMLKRDQGKKLKFISQNEKQTENMEKLNAALDEWDHKSPFTSPYLIYMVNDKEKCLVIKVYPVSDNSEEYILILQDVSQEREKEEVLVNALNMADGANKAKTEFLSNMSHDIRTPMNAIINMVDFALKDISNTNKVVNYLTTIQSSSKHLLGLINEILDMSRVESGKMTLAIEAFDIVKCVEEVCDIIRPLCAVKEQKFIYTKSKVRNRILLGDSMRLNQVLINILNNAIKFTENSGTITLRFSEQHAISRKTAAYKFEISDTGIGIAQEDLEKVFNPFVRAENTNVRTTEGTGLGLSISKRFVEAMGGQLNIKSEIGVGTTMIIDISFDKKTSEKIHKQIQTESLVEYDLSGIKALLAEDNEINQEIAYTILTNLGIKVDMVSNGEEAVNQFKASHDKQYDIIYMDVQMPVMNGYEACREIRCSEHPQAKSIPIMAMTANVMAEDVEQARIAGMNAHVGKPINPRELKSVTAGLLKKAGKAGK